MMAWTPLFKMILGQDRSPQKRCFISYIVLVVIQVGYKVRQWCFREVNCSGFSIGWQLSLFQNRCQWIDFSTFFKGLLFCQVVFLVVEGEEHEVYSDASPYNSPIHEKLNLYIPLIMRDYALSSIWPSWTHSKINVFS